MTILNRFKISRLCIPLLCLALAACAGLPGGEQEEEPKIDVNEVLRQRIGEAGPETLGLAQKAVEEERYADAERLLERIFVSDKDSLEGKLLVAEIRLGRGDPAGALGIFAELTKEPSVAARALQGHGITLFLIGDEISAERVLRQALELDSELWRAWNAIGAYHDSQMAWKEAEDSYRRALAMRPDVPFLHNNLGFSLFMQGRGDEAVVALGKALKLDPTFELARTNMRLAFARDGQYVRAISGTDEKDLGRVLNNVGYIALLRGDYESAEAYFHRAMEVEPSFNKTAWRNLKYLHTLQDLEALPTQ